MASLRQAKPVQTPIQNSVWVIDLAVSDKVEEVCWHSQSLDSAPVKWLGAWHSPLSNDKKHGKACQDHPQTQVERPRGNELRQE